MVVEHAHGVGTAKPGVHAVRSLLAEPSGDVSF